MPFLKIVQIENHNQHFCHYLLFAVGLNSMHVLQCGAESKAALLFVCKLASSQEYYHYIILSYFCLAGLSGSSSVWRWLQV